MKLSERLDLLGARFDLHDAEKRLYKHIKNPASYKNGGQRYNVEIVRVSENNVIKYYTGAVYDDLGSRRVELVNDRCSTEEIVYYYGERGIYNKYMTLDTINALVGYINAFLEKEEKANAIKTNELRSRVNSLK